METTTNHVILVGLLDTTRQRRQQVARAERRSRLGGVFQTFGMQLETPFGDPFRAIVTTGLYLEGAELLDEERIGKPIVVEGRLQTRIVTDRRYAVADGGAGRVVRETQVRAERVREPLADEVIGSTHVWLEGEIVTPPRFGRHRLVPSLELARTILRVRHVAADRPGAGDEADLSLTVERGTEGATYAIRPGNRVSVEARLDSVVVPAGGGAVTARLQQLDAEWRERQSGISDRQELEAERRRYRRERERLGETTILTVLPMAITPLDGAQPGDWEAAQMAATTHTATTVERTPIPPRV